MSSKKFKNENMGFLNILLSDIYITTTRIVRPSFTIASFANAAHIFSPSVVFTDTIVLACK